ncbi:MAG: MBL fold metallo-hydrolase [Candidatus Woesearchaeota archaeon]
MAEIEGINISWLGHSGFAFRNDKVIYIDPYKVSGSPEKADIILVTHNHYDHCSVEDIKKLIKPETIIVTVPDCQSKVSGMEVANVTLMRPGDKASIKGTMVEAVHAYNNNKQFHPKENEWVGFIVTINGKRIYHAGDTDLIPEMKQLQNIDLALLPVSGTYVMTAEEAAQAVDSFRPKTAVPMHYGSVVGTLQDAERFRERAGTNVTILEKE